MASGKKLSGMSGLWRPAATAFSILLLSGCASQSLKHKTTATAASDPTNQLSAQTAAPNEMADTIAPSQSLEMYVYPKDSTSSGYQVVIDL